MEIKSTKNKHTDQLKCLVMGKAGIGKTSLLGTLPDLSTTIIISGENGLLSLNDFDIDCIEVNSWQEVQQAVKLILDAGKYKTICIDSLTELSSMLLNFIKSIPKYQDPKMMLKLYGEYTDKILAFVKYVRDLQDYNIVITALTEDKEDGGYLIKKPQIQGGSAQKILTSLFDLVFFMETDEKNNRVLRTSTTDTYEAKDRSGKLSNTEQPNLSKIIRKIKGELKNDTI